MVLAYQGDGDLGAIGTAEIVHAANRGEPITVIFVNNGIYGMTGGQMAPTTPLGKKTTTTPFGRNALLEGYPLHICELLATLDAPVFLERVALGDNKQIMKAAKVLHKAVENQVKGLGFSLVEVLSPCPTIWKLDPVGAQRFVREEMAATFPIGNYRDRTVGALARPEQPAPPPLEQLPGILGLQDETDGAASPAPPSLDLRIKVAGFGGQGVLMLGEVLAEAGLQSGYHVSWLPSYGPEMRSGTSNCHVRIGSREVDSPLVSRPNVLVALNEPSLRKFLPGMEPGGILIYNADQLPDDCVRTDVRSIALPFTTIADEVGLTKAANMVVLGTLLEATNLLDIEQVTSALRKLIKNDRYFEMDVRAIERGREEARKITLPVNEDYLWGV
jgi:2-oxoisovalerate ferredoxin oxidoreductase beta subunit